MLNFTVGPVQSPDCVREIGSWDVPYFRTPEFSAVMKENENLFCEFVNAPKGSRSVFVTGSGTAGMEAAVINTLTTHDKALVIKGGGFGARFCELCELHGIPHQPVELERCKPLTEKDLLPYEDKGYTALLVNIHETSTGVLYDSALIGSFCKRNNLFLIVDAISSFLADPLDMTELGADIVITGSQKALACPPGVSIACLSPQAISRVHDAPMRCMYLDYGLLLSNGERGQTPFTPAVGILLQINARLRNIKEKGGPCSEIDRVSMLAHDFRSRVKHLPFVPLLESPSNAVTFISTPHCSAKEIFQVLKDEFSIWICPNGGSHADDSFRVGHIGNLSIEDNVALVAAFDELNARGVLR